MEITSRGLWTLIHGMGFGALYLLACSGALVELHFITRSPRSAVNGTGSERFLKVYLVVMAALAWFAVLSGAYVIYPWYRAVPTAANPNLAMFPQRFLISSSSTAGWHSFGMEWKEYVAWFAPISITMVAFVFLRYGRDLGKHRHLRGAVLCFALIAFLTGAVAGLLGALINKQAPVQGGYIIRLVTEGQQ